MPRIRLGQIVRRDAILIAGVVLAGLTAFHPTLQRVFDWVKDVEAQRHVSLLPGLAVLLAALALHGLLRRQQVRTAAAESAAEVRAMRRLSSANSPCVSATARRLEAGSNRIMSAAWLSSVSISATKRTLLASSNCSKSTSGK